MYAIRSYYGPATVYRREKSGLAFLLEPGKAQLVQDVEDHADDAELRVVEAPFDRQVRNNFV